MVKPKCANETKKSCADSDSSSSNPLCLQFPCARGTSLCRERVRVRDICAAQLSDAPHILSPRKLGMVPHPTLEDERRPLPTQGEAINSALKVLTGAERRILLRVDTGEARNPWWVSHPTLLFFFLSFPLCACAPVAPPAPRPVMVEIPIATPIYCQVPKLQPPTLAIAALTADSLPADTVRSYAASVDVLKSAVHERDAILEACAPPEGASAPSLTTSPQPNSKDEVKAAPATQNGLVSTFCKILSWPWR